MDNSPEAVKGRVRSMTKAIRYKARKEGNLMKAFNDYMGSQSGISATERSAVKRSLGLSENRWRTLKSDWRSELVEVSSMTDEKDDKMVKEKKVKNKIIINPTMGMKEAFEEIGGTIVEVVELSDDSDDKKKELLEKSREKDIEQGRVPGRLSEMMSSKEVQLQKRRAMIDMQVARERKRQVSQVKPQTPTNPVGEGYAPGDIDQKVGAVTPIPKKEQDAARARILAKAKAKREARMKEEVEVDEAMMAGPRKDAMKKKEYMAKSGSDRAIAFNIGTRRDVSTSDPTIKSRGGRTDKRTGEGDRGGGNAAKRRMKEEASDAMKDRRMETGGVDGNVDYSKPPKNTNNEFGKKKPSGKSALDIVKAQIRAKHGKGAIMDIKKK